MTRRRWWWPVVVAALACAGPAAAEDGIDEAAVSCIQCHEAQHVRTELIGQWRGSVHYRSGVTCGQCHGFSDVAGEEIPAPGEGAHTKPDPGTVIFMCTQCHREWLEYYPTSAHFRQERQTCLMCHATGGNSHGIQPASLAIIHPERCSKCHSFERARKAKDLLSGAEHALVNLDGMVALLRARGERSARLDELFEAAEALQSRVRLELHTFRLKRIEAATAEIATLEGRLDAHERRALAAYIAQAGPPDMVDESAILCIECHADMSEEHARLIDDWRGSIHYRNRITCGQCHGFTETDLDAMPDPGEGAHRKPDAEAVVSMCGRCHRAWMDYYPLSAHFRQERQSCVMCHASGGDSHNIQAASLGIIREERCAECHSYDWARQARDAFTSTETAVLDLDETLERLAAQGYQSARLERMQESIHELKARVPLELHTFQLQRIKAIATSITDIDTHVSEEEERILRKLATTQRRQRIGVFVAVSCFVLSGLILAFRQTYIDDWRARHGPPPGAQ